MFYPRPLFSSLLLALPRREWFETDHTYIGFESDYIAEVAADLFYVEGRAMGKLFMHLLPMTRLKTDKRRKVCEILLHVSTRLGTCTYNLHI